MFRRLVATRSALRGHKITLKDIKNKSRNKRQDNKSYSAVRDIDQSLKLASVKGKQPTKEVFSLDLR